MRRGKSCWTSWHGAENKDRAHNESCPRRRTAHSESPGLGLGLGVGVRPLRVKAQAAGPPGQLPGRPVGTEPCSGHRDRPAHRPGLYVFDSGLGPRRRVRPTRLNWSATYTQPEVIFVHFTKNTRGEDEKELIPRDTSAQNDWAHDVYGAIHDAVYTAYMTIPHTIHDCRARAVCCADAKTGRCKGGASLSSHSPNNEYPPTAR